MIYCVPLCASVKWLSHTETLCAQGVKDGDMVLLRLAMCVAAPVTTSISFLFRKKFFIFNDDILEAEHNQLLRDLLYNQVSGGNHNHMPSH